MTDWISCKDRLPEPGVVVIACICYPVVPPLVRQANRRFTRPDYWYIDDSFDSVPEERVTHWQPLPAPPEAP